jgi:hypothetical protein
MDVGDFPAGMDLRSAVKKMEAAVYTTGTTFRISRSSW